MKCLHVLKQDGVTALMNACQGGHVDVVRLLILAGANKNLQDKVNAKRLDKSLRVLCCVCIDPKALNNYNLAGSIC